MLRDLRTAGRYLTRHPVFAITIVLTIGLALAVNATVFAAVNAALLRPLPFHDSDRLLSIEAVHQTDGRIGGVSTVDLDAYAEATDVLAAVGAWFRQPEDRFDTDVLMRFISVPVSTTFFDVLGTPPAMGRTFLPEDSSETHVVVLSHGFWQRRFGGRADVLGQQLRFGDETYRILGVMPASFHHVDGLPADLWTPMWPMRPSTGRRETSIARLRDGVSIAQAQAQADLIAARLAAAHPASHGAWGARLVPLRNATTLDVRGALLALSIGVGLVLLIACANVGNMLVARNLARGQELRVRLALGASRRVVVREAAIESVLLALAGGIVGVALTFAFVRTLVMLMPPTLPRLTLASVDGRVWLWMFGSTALVALLSAIAPAMAASRVRLADAWARMTTDARMRHLRGALVVAEVALATVLVVGAGLMVRTIVNLRGADLGFEPARLVTVYLRPGWGISRQGPDMAVYYQAVRERLSSLPGVRGVGAAKGLPLVSDVTGFDTRVSARAPGDEDVMHTARMWYVVPCYFEALGIPVLHGRVFEGADDIARRDVAIVSAGLARRVFGDREAIGRMVYIGKRPLAVVGVVGDVKTAPGAAAADTIYLTGSNGSARLTIHFAVAVDGDPEAMAGPIRDAIASVERNVAILDVGTMTDAFARTVGYPRLLTWVLNVFGAAGLLMAAIGVYGLGAFSVAERRREMGLRIAIGAGRGAIVRLIVGSHVGVAAVGALLGIALALGLARYLASALYGVSPTDPVTIAVTGGILLATAVGASWLPARRAANVDPSELLRD